MIRTEGLTKVYDKVKAVDTINLDIGKGEVYGFIGPNGSGKTTTIGMMVGLIEPTAGKCFVDDVEVSRKPLQAKRITGYLPDGVGFYGNMSAKQNLKYFSKFYGMKDADADKRIAELLEYVGLKGVEKPVGGYSRGMKQRLGLAQALLNDPKAIFLDEPTNGLDPQGVIQFRKIIKDLSAQGKTIFFSSHILDEVQHVCTKIGIITKGKLIASGTPDEVKGLMGGHEYVTIHVKVKGSMPKLEDVRIIDAVYNNGSAVIKAKSDIREDISQTLFSQSILIKELKVEEKTLEDIFLDTVYRSE